MPDECTPKGVQIAYFVDVDTAGESGFGALSDAAHLQSRLGFLHPPPGQDDHDVTGVDDQVLIEEDRADDGKVAQQGDGLLPDVGPGEVHVGIAQK